MVVENTRRWRLRLRGAEVVSARDYLLTLELVNIQTGEPDKEHATIRKGYHKTRVGAWKKY